MTAPAPKIAMAAGVPDRLWEMKDLIEMLETFEASRKRAG
jgi:hypothetical protein